MEKLVEYLTEFVKIFDTNYSVREAGEFEALLDEDVITVYKGFTLSDFYFISNMYRCEGGKDLPLLHPFTWGFLHELGHLETVNEMENDVPVRLQMLQNDDSARDSFEEYCQLHNERLANDWARDFVAENVEIARHFDRHITEMLSE